MAQQKYRKAYDAYQQAVYRDGRNPTFWCSIGVLYYQINQYRDALDAYSRAIRLNPYLSEVWYDLGTLYESCNQISDSLDAYQRAAELDPANKHIQQRLTMLRAQLNGEVPGQHGKALPKNPSGAKMDGVSQIVAAAHAENEAQASMPGIPERRERDDHPHISSSIDQQHVAMLDRERERHSRPAANGANSDIEPIPPMNPGREEESEDRQGSPPTNVANGMAAAVESLRSFREKDKPSPSPPKELKKRSPESTSQSERGTGMSAERESKLEESAAAVLAQKRDKKPLSKPNTADLLAAALGRSGSEKFGEGLKNDKSKSLETKNGNKKERRKRAKGKRSRENVDGEKTKGEKSSKRVKSET
eukprot:TRINITY_DN3628_c0_g1_i2.p1 TRINITY_DN3628_c0_g1~~TRINITY_DN3628_c0_g1_i2.p1  ORF type:complete len:362 (-),score=118.13 TRINITY_DN3628_c0_g1_i2:56-1141(-)